MPFASTGRSQRLDWQPTYRLVGRCSWWREYRRFLKGRRTTVDIKRMKCTHDIKGSTFLAMIIVALCASPRATSAQPYATAAAGVSRNNVDCSTFPVCEKTDVAFKLIGGYRMAPWIAGEAVYLDFGEERRASNLVEDTMKTSGFGGGVAFHGNVASWTVTARVGAARAATTRTIAFVQGRTDSATFNDVAPYGGVGISYRFSGYVALTFGFDAMRSKWERSDGLGYTWTSTAATAGVTIGR